jgi:N-acetylmuramoyl-L-alanine amidase
VAVDVGHGVCTKGKRSPDQKYEHSVLEWELNRDQGYQVGYELFQKEIDNVGITDSWADCNLKARAECINFLFEENPHLVSLSMHNNAKGNKWQSDVADTRVIYGNSRGSKELAQHIVARLEAMGRKAMIKYRPGLYLPRKVKAPFALVEMCWMDNKADLKYEHENQHALCKAVADGVEDYYDGLDCYNGLEP